MNKNGVFHSETKKKNNSISDDTVLAIKNFSKKYPSQNEYSVKDLNIEIKRGQFHAFIGSNGAGKTTTIKSIIGATKNFEGKIYINKLSNDSSKSLAKVAYVPEVAIFPPKMNLINFLLWNARMVGFRKNQAKKIIKNIIKKLNLEKFEYKKPANFSSGEQKKVLLAQALLKNPDIFVMDEPAANLDPQTRFELFGYLKQLQEEGKTIFISSHVLNEIGEYADSLTVIEKGRLKISGYISEFSNTNKNHYLLNPFDFELAKDFFIKKEFDYKIKDKSFEIEFDSEKSLLAFLEAASQSKIFFKVIEKIELTLKDIYSKEVLKENQKMH